MIIVFSQKDLFISRNSQVISCLFISIILFSFLGHPTTMSSENIACCLMCRTNFNSHDELFVHSCKEIKVETNDLEIEEKIKQEDFVLKDISETDSDYSPKKKKRKKSVQNKKIKKDVKDSEKSINSDSKKKVGRQIKKKVENGIKEEIKVLDDQKQCDISVNSYFELSEDFISSILKQVDELCDNIRNGDPDINRTIVVNDNLNNAVSCYKDKLINIKSENQINYSHIEMNSGSDGEYLGNDTNKARRRQKLKNKNSKNPKNANLPKVKGKAGPKHKPENDVKAELARNQCGEHSINSLCLMLNTSQSTLESRGAWPWKGNAQGNLSRGIVNKPDRRQGISKLLHSL